MVATNSKNDIFNFKQFSIDQSHCAMKVGTDGILLGAWSDVSNASSVLDIGTGNGLIALMIAQRTQNAHIHAVEISESACRGADDNFKSSPWADRLSAKNDSIQDFASNNSEKYQLIVCNPPFFSGGTLSSNSDKNSVRHTIKLSHNDLLRSVRALLSADGKFCVILPKLEGLRFIEIANTYGLHCSNKTEVRSRKSSKVERLLLEFSLQKQDIAEHSMDIYQETSSDWSDDFKKLTSEFYL